jgi:hypothetical protein
MNVDLLMIGRAPNRPSGHQRKPLTAASLGDAGAVDHDEDVGPVADDLG